MKNTKLIGCTRTRIWKSLGLACSFKKDRPNPQTKKKEKRGKGEDREQGGKGKGECKYKHKNKNKYKHKEKYTKSIRGQDIGKSCLLGFKNMVLGGTAPWKKRARTLEKTARDNPGKTFEY